MTRYSISGATTEQISAVGGTNVVVGERIGLIFATLSEAAVIKLINEGCTVVQVKSVQLSDAEPTGRVPSSVFVPRPIEPIVAGPVYTPSQLFEFGGYEDLRSVTDPPLYGENINVALLDTGIRSTHERVGGNIVYSKNFADGAMADGFNHGTGVASILRAVAPKCGIVDMRVIGNTGEGTEEAVALAINDCIDLHNTDMDVAPTIISMSLGAIDDGNPSNPMRVACRAALERHILVEAAAGNLGPNSHTITSPATERYVAAVGSVGVSPFIISEFSARGPTQEELIKPDVVFYGENVVLASSKSDTETINKSGTSFALPFGAGITALFQEGLIRRVSFPGGVPKGFDPELLAPLTAVDMIDKYIPRISGRPEGTGTAKDNVYGYGMPISELIRAALAPAILDISSIITPMMLVMMMGLMMGTLDGGG